MENDDLKVNLTLNKDSLKEMLKEQAQSAAKEASLIQTITILSQENTRLTEHVNAQSTKITSMSKSNPLDKSVKDTKKNVNRFVQTDTKKCKDFGSSTVDLIKKSSMAVQTGNQRC